MHEKRPSVNADKDNRDVRLSDKDCKEVVIKVLQHVITNILETNEKKKTLTKRKCKGEPNGNVGTEKGNNRD